ncbi:MAG: class I SAM-dependent methyltransferase [Clostridium sp.]|nr:class I SAM-dependent methyltransferase [Clostridium sp.]
MNNENKQEWWIDFFKGDYSEVVLNQRAYETLRFMRRTGRIEAGMTVFDQCCGKGYLAREFDRLGLFVVGIDMSEEYIASALRDLDTTNATFLLGDAKEFVSAEPFDICVNWNTSFGYDSDDRENERMLSTFGRNLRSGGQFFMSTMNPLFICRHFQQFIVKEIPSGDSTIVTIRKSRIEGHMMISDWLIIYPDGRREKRYGQTRLYGVNQFRQMLSRQGLRLEAVYGDIEGGTYDENHPSLIMYGHKI